MYYIPSQTNKCRWISYFEGNSDAIIFCHSATSYCQFMPEDGTINRMLSSLALFESIINNPLVQLKLFIVFINKIDLLHERLLKYPVKRFLPHYFHNNDSKSFLSFICEEFKKHIHNGKQNL
jgi:hypothetical protein